MSGKRKRASKSSKSPSDQGSSTPPKKKKDQEEKLPFVVWFGSKVREGRLGFWQEKEIQVFFKENKLADEEPPKKYDECLKRY